ncbi:MAG: hypothetical protein IIZ39_11100 [Blautia sp.]|nr:hypothetical protein [Blautia sp.]
MLYKKTMENRKVLVKRLQELTGMRAVYTRMPECAFMIDDYKVEKNGTLIVGDDADMEPIQTLLAEGLIVPLIPEETSTSPEEEENTPEEGANIPMEEEVSTLEEEANIPPEEEANIPAEEEAITLEEAVNTPEEEATTLEEETDHQTMEEQIVSETEEQIVSEEQTVSEEQPTDETDRQGEVGGAADESLSISLPVAKHCVTSIRNLVGMIYARADLISKATGGEFACPKELVEALDGATTIEDIIAEINEGGMKGLTITPERITFNGFPWTEDDDKVKAFTQLVTLMGKMALKTKRVLARRVEADNERYIFRIWLIRLGMSGKEYATARKVLLGPLSGNAAFKDKDMEDRWKAKRTQNRQENAESEE